MDPGLESAVEPGEIVDALKAYGVTEAEIAGVTHCSERVVHSRREGTVNKEDDARLADLRDLVVLLSDSFTELG